MKPIVFHSFRMGDVEDPEIYAAQPIHEWEKSEQGQWVMEHCADPQFRISPDSFAWGHTVTIYGMLTEEHATWWQLKWGHVKA